mgnify:CR=1 FL=1
MEKTEYKHVLLTQWITDNISSVTHELLSRVLMTDRDDNLVTHVTHYKVA